MCTWRKRPFRFDNFVEYTRQKIMHSSSKNTKYRNSGMRSYLIISSYIFSFTIYINFFSSVLRCHTAIQIFTSPGIHVPRIQRVVPLRLKQSVRYIMKFFIYESSYKDTSIVLNMTINTYLNRQWKGLHAAASRAKFISSPHS